MLVLGLGGRGVPIPLGGDRYLWTLNHIIKMIKHDNMQNCKFLCMSTCYLLPDFAAMTGDVESKRCGQCLPPWLADSELLRNWKQVLGAWIVFFITAGLTYHAPPVMLNSIKVEFGTDAYGIAWLGAIFQLPSFSLREVFRTYCIILSLSMFSFLATPPITPGEALLQCSS